MHINWQNIDTVLLDMDGTLLDLHFDNFFWLEHLPKRYADQNQDSDEDIIGALRQQLFDKQGTLEWYCTDYWSSQLGVNIIALKQEISHLIKERPQAHSFLSALKAHQKKCVLITNAHPDAVALKFSVTRIEPLFDKVISSHQYGHPERKCKNFGIDFRWSAHLIQKEPYLLMIQNQYCVPPILMVLPIYSALQNPIAIVRLLCQLNLTQSVTLRKSSR